MFIIRLFPRLRDRIKKLKNTIKKGEETVDLAHNSIPFIIAGIIVFIMIGITFAVYMIKITS